MMLKPTTKFEHEVCPRCGGTGEFSYNHRDGKKCLGCNGSGYVFTKRGAAAHAFFAASLEKPAGKLVAGDKIYDNLIGWSTVTEVTVYDATAGTLDIRCENGGFQNYAPGTTFRVAHTAEQKAEKMTAALAYQETLTKAGAPRK